MQETKCDVCKKVLLNPYPVYVSIKKDEDNHFKIDADLCAKHRAEFKKIVKDFLDTDWEEEKY